MYGLYEEGWHDGMEMRYRVNIATYMSAMECPLSESAFGSEPGITTHECVYTHCFDIDNMHRTYKQGRKSFSPQEFGPTTAKVVDQFEPDQPTRQQITSIDSSGLSTIS